MAIDNREVLVTNRSNGLVCYRIPDLNVNRTFNNRETKRIPYEELRILAQQAGGRELIYNFLYVQDKEILEEALNVKEEPEYWLTEEKIPTWINSCSIEEFKDALDFAPEGVKDLIKKFAVSVPLNASDKREAIKEQLDFDVTKVIENGLDTSDGASNAPVSGKIPPKRRAKPTYKVTETK